MTRLIVIEKEGEGLSREIARCIGDSRGVSERISVIGAASPDEITLSGTDILLVSPNYRIPAEGALKRLRCRILLLPGGARASFADADCIVTYGMRPRDSITLSSISEKGCVLALQRELVTSSGDILDRQELVVHSPLDAGSLLAVYGALLLAGVNPVV